MWQAFCMVCCMKMAVKRICYTVASCLDSFKLSRKENEYCCDSLKWQSSQSAMHEMQPIKIMETLLQPLKIKFMCAHAHTKPPQMVSLMRCADFFYVCGHEPVTLLFSCLPNILTALAVELIECHRKFNLNISNL